MKSFFTLLIALSAFCMRAQTSLTTSIRGTIIDKQSQFPIIGATITVIDVAPVKGATSDIEGRFRINDIPVGRHSVQIQFTGYEPQLIANLLLNSGKDLELNAQLVESIQQLGTVEVVGEQSKSESINKMSSVSTRSFSIDEAMRYSGTLQDPARMAQNYAGVSNASDDRNDIIVRGNSPTGVLWRMEGIDIPSPNHFSTLGTTGGPVSMLNINNLANSDFSTSAFSSEYGNALSGVFDLRLRAGNRDKREYTGQMGFNGIELGAEGPFKKGGSATYIANYRYSFLGIMKNLGINFGTGSAIPEYHDLTFKMEFPTQKAGKFTLFGIGGKSFIDFKADPNEENNLYATEKQNSQFSSQTGVFGASHSYFFTERTFGKLVIAASTTENSGYIDTLDIVGAAHKYFGVKNQQDKYSAHYFVNTKINASNTFKIGAMYDLFNFNVQDSVRYVGNYFFKEIDAQDKAGLSRAYATWQWRPTEKWTVNTGLYSQIFFLNNKSSIEPRLGARYKLNNKQTVSFGAGLHSQLQPIVSYFRREELDNGQSVANNRSLDFNKALHFVIGYDYQLTSHMRLKSEMYYQSLFNIAVDRASSSFSMLNTGADFTTPNNADLVNTGSGYNYGVELTIERFLNKGYYFLFTTSLFESKYKGSDGVERNTAFNGNYVFNLLSGKEWLVGENNSITFDFKVTYAGGRWHAPIDLVASQNEQREVRDLTKNFSEQYKAYFRVDTKLGFRMNGKKVAQAIFIDIRNVSNNQNIFSQTYSRGANSLKTTYQTGFFPMVLYTIYF